MAFSSIAISPVQANDRAANIKEVRNEVGIMLNILQASLRQQNSDKNIRFKSHAVFYLANQGVVFEIGSDRHGSNLFGFDLSGLNDLMHNIPMVPKVAERQIEIDIDESEIERMVKNIVKHGDDDDYDDELSDKIRDLKEEQRELSWEKREYQRSLRDLEFEKRNADKNRRKDIERQVAKLNQDVIDLEAKANSLEKFRHELHAERNQEMAKRQAVKKKLYKESLASFEDTIGDVLCRYGAGLRSLPNDENITFLLSDFIDADNDSDINSHDKVYVFTHQDVKACVTGKIDKSKLLMAAQSYLF